MTVLEAIGLAWVIFTSALSTIAIVYLAFLGFKTVLGVELKKAAEVPAQVKEMFKIAR
jgi:hypothetical protein